MHMSGHLIKGIIGGDDFIVETVLTGLSRSENLSEYWIVAQNEGRCEELRKKYNINATTDMNFISDASVLILAFRFKEAKDMLSKLAAKISEDTILISVVPGIATVFINGFFPKNQIVRLTFNPSIISGEGIAAYVANDRASNETKVLARDMLVSFGRIIEVSSEDEFEKLRKFIHANTFLSYIVVKSIVDAAHKLGFSLDQSGVLIDQIFKGASHTLIKFQFEGNEMLKDGLRNKKFANQAIDTIREYGIYDEIERYLTSKDSSALFDTNNEDDTEHFNLHYDWFESVVSK